MLWLNRPALPRAGERRADAGTGRVADLLRRGPLRRVFIASGLLNMAWDLYAFVIPIYGSRISLSASTIGMVMGSFAIATFAVRLLLPLAFGALGAALGMFPVFWSMAALLGAGAYLVNRRQGNS